MHAPQASKLRSAILHKPATPPPSSDSASVSSMDEGSDEEGAAHSRPSASGPPGSGHHASRSPQPRSPLSKVAPPSPLHPSPFFPLSLNDSFSGRHRAKSVPLDSANLLRFTPVFQASATCFAGTFCHSE